MCMEDVRIARSVKSYIRSVTLAGAVVSAIPANPRRYGLILPSPYTNLIGWNLGKAQATVNSRTMFITGCGNGPNALNDIALEAVILNLHNLGQAVTQELFASIIIGAAVTVDITELVFDEKTFNDLFGGL